MQKASTLPPLSCRDISYLGRKEWLFSVLSVATLRFASAATANVDLTLVVGSNAETVTISEAASLIQSQSGVVSSLVDSKQMVALLGNTQLHGSCCC